MTIKNINITDANSENLMFPKCTTDSPIADFIMDRISYDSYKINMESIDPKLSEKSAFVALTNMDKWLSSRWTGGFTIKEYSFIFYSNRMI